MWTTKSQPSSTGTSTSSNVESEKARWTGISPALFPEPQLSVNDGKPVVNLPEQTPATHVACVQVETGEFLVINENKAENIDSSKRAISVYVDHEGHIVKLARLDGYQSSHSSFSNAPRNSKNSGKSYPQKTDAAVEKIGKNQTKHVIKSCPVQKSSSHSKSVVASVQSQQQGCRSNVGSERHGSVPQLTSKSSASNCTNPRDQIELPLRKESKTLIETELVDLDGLHCCSTKTGNGVKPSGVKDQLNHDLKEIMADLASLNLPPLNDVTVEKKSDKTDVLFSKEDLAVEAGSGKENDLPHQQRGIITTHSKDDNKLEKVQSSKPLYAPRLQCRAVGNFAKLSSCNSKRSSTSSLNSVNKILANQESSHSRVCKSYDKPKGYDPEKARAFINQQKKERMNRMKAERERQQADMNLRRRKLDELNQISQKLVKASIKRKPSKMNNNQQENGVMESPWDHINTSQKSVGSGSSNNLNKVSNGVENATSHFSNSIFDPIPVKNLPPSLDDSNAQLIKDICEMKCKIEAMAKSLKSTLEANHEENDKLLTNLRINSAPSGRRASSICEPHSHHASNIYNASNEKERKIVTNSNLPVSATSMDVKPCPPYLHKLTSNLREMRKSLQNVLGQSETLSSSSPGKSHPLTVPDSHVRNGRVSSADSDTACDLLKSRWETHSSTGPLSNSLQKKRITTSFPSLLLTENEHTLLDRQLLWKSNSKSGLSGDGTKTDISSVPVTSQSFAEQPDAHDAFGRTAEENLQSCTVQNDCPEWIEPLTSKPYPVNFISAVKMKLGSSAKSDHFSDNKSAYVGSIDFASAHSGPDEVASQNAFKYPSLDLKSNPPLFVTTRHVLRSAPSHAAWSLENSNNLALSMPHTSLKSATTNPHDSLQFGSEFRNNLTHDSVSLKSSILDALNLERMQAEFVKAMNPEAGICDDMTPAEKPLSAPNTPAKKSLKLERPILSGMSRVTKVSDQVVLDAKKSPEAGIYLSDSHSEKPFAPSKANNMLIPPDLSLSSTSLEKKIQGDGVSPSKACKDKTTLASETEEKSSVSTQQPSSSQDSFEIGHVFNPTALHLQFQAELNILDSFNESLCQVMEVEKVCAVAQARHLAFSESTPVSKEDKGIDVQTSLPKSSSEVSSINYHRGSGDLENVSLHVFNTRNSDTKVHQHPNSSSEQNGKKDAGSNLPSSSIEPDYLDSFASKTSPNSTSSLKSMEERSPLPVEPSAKLSEESISEDIDTQSESLREEFTPSITNEPAPQLSLKENDSNEKNELSHKNLEMCKTLDTLNNLENYKNVDRSLPIDVSFNSAKADSTFKGADFLIESLQLSDKSFLPQLASGEDMFQFSLQMLEQLMHEEELRVQHKNTLLKLRVKVLGEMARAEVASLDLDKKKLREKGEGGHKDQITALRKKQRGIMLKFQQQREEIERIRRTEELAWQERRLMYLQQMHLVRMQLSTQVMLHKFEKTGGNMSKRGRVVCRSIQDSHYPKASQKSSHDLPSIPPEMPLGLAVTQSSSVSLASLASDVSKSSAVSGSSRRASGAPIGASTGVGAGDSESSHLEERILRGLNELENRRRNLKDRERVLHERRQAVEQFIQWKRKLEEEENRVRDREKQSHRQRASLAKHMLRDRSTSPFQFLENGGTGCVMVGNNGSASRNILETVRSSANSVGQVSVTASAIEDMDSSVPEELGESTSKPSCESILEGSNVEQYANESFESELSEVRTLESQSTFPEVSKTVTMKEQSIQQPPKIDSDSEARIPRLSERSNKFHGVTIKVPLSPRLQRVHRRRYSSGSDDSMVLSQTETGSEQSDIEGRISALSEQLHQCKAEAERLRREAKRTRNERLIAKEQSLQKQLQAYENYICQLRHNLEAELKQSSVPIVRPQIKQPRVASGKVASRRQDADLISNLGVDRSGSHSTSLDAQSTSNRRDEIDTEVKEAETTEVASVVVSEGASEIASEAASEAPSDALSETSEVSGNSSLVSQEAPSLLVNKEDVLSSQDSTLHRKNEKHESGSYECESIQEVLSEAKSEERTDENISSQRGSSRCKDSHDIVEFSGRSNISLEESDCSLDILKKSVEPCEDENRPACHKSYDRKVDAFVDSEQEVVSQIEDDVSAGEKGDITASVDQVKSISSEEDFDEVSDTLEDDCEIVTENVVKSNVIQVFVREKEKDIQNLEQNVPSYAAVSKEAKQSEVVDQITNELFKNLLSESLQSAISAHTRFQNAALDQVVNLSLQEATSDIINIYKKRVNVPQTSSKDIRRRVTEILAESNSSSKLCAEGRIKEMMTTTYGVLTPDDSPCASPNLPSSPVEEIPVCTSSNEDADTTYHEMAETSARKSNVGKANDAPMGLMGENAMDNEGIAQEWFDEDFGLTRSRREAEELRRQQLEIEQEIEQLQQQQAQVHEQIPYYYVREIPNKPPPPYTPPGQAPRVLSSSTSFSSSLDEVRAVCTERAEILKAIELAVDLLYDARNRGLEVQSQEASSSFTEAGFKHPQPSLLSEQELEVYKNNARVYRKFLFDLAKELVQNAYSCDFEDPSPPWLRPENWVSRRKALAVVPKTKEMLHDLVSRQVLVLFGFVPKASKENLTIRWSRKKRDHVDELLVRESQEEERQWTNYEQDEAVVKNNVAMAILDSLLDDTVQVLGDVFRRREQRKHRSAH